MIECHEQDLLYAMFIYRANSKFYHWYEANFINELEWLRSAGASYADLYSDRSECELSQEEFDSIINLVNHLYVEKGGQDAVV